MGNFFRAYAFLPVPSTVDSKSSTSLVIIPCGGLVVMVTQTGNDEPLSAIAARRETENSTTAQEEHFGE